jgi:hypothetical protein
VESYSNLRLLLASPGSDRAMEIYAKVVKERTSDEAAFPEKYLIHFTSLATEVKSFLGELIAQQRGKPA